jgi:hypothetical protein
VDYHIYFRCSAEVVEDLVNALEARADRFLESHPRYGYDLDDSAIIDGPPDADAAYEASGDDLDDDVVARIQASQCVLEWRNQPHWQKDPMSRSLLAEILRSGLATLVSVDDESYETPESLLAHFRQNRFEIFAFPKVNQS